MHRARPRHEPHDGAAAHSYTGPPRNQPFERPRPGGLNSPSLAPYRAYLDWLQDCDGDAAERAWSEALAGIDEPTRLAAARAYAEAPEVLSLRLPAAATARLSARTRALGVTVGTAVQAAWALMLARHCRRDDFSSGSGAEERGSGYRPESGRARAAAASAGGDTAGPAATRCRPGAG